MIPKEAKLEIIRKKARRGELDSNSGMGGGNVWNKGTQKYYTKMVRQRGLSGKRGR